MFKNYITIAVRNLTKNKVHSFLNIAGLSVGMAVAMVIGLWIWDEMSFDKYHSNYGRIAQAMEQKLNNGEINTSVAIPRPLEPALKKNFGSDFKRVVISSWLDGHILSVGDKKIKIQGQFMGAGGAEIFSLPMIKGNVQALQGLSSIFISQSTAKAIFDGAEPMGKPIKVDNDASLTVAGVYADLPENTSLHALGFVAPWDYYVASHDWVRNAANDWGENSFQLYVQLNDNADLAKVSAKIKDVKLKNVNAEGAKYKPAIILHPMSKWHLYSEFKNGVNTGGAIEYVWMFGIIGAFVLLLACINFMNLSTARSEKRAKEVGIRKAIGSLRVQLVSQFFCESMLMAVVAFVAAAALVQIVLPYFNKMASKHIAMPWGNIYFWLACAGFTLFTGFVAGIYPALYLSSFKPVKVLKGTFKAGRLAALPRKVLVVAQFAVSVMLIIGTIVVFNQIQFAKNRPVGYTRNGLVNLEMVTDDLNNHFEAAKNELVSAGAITDMAEASSPMTGIHNNRGDLDWKEKDPGTTYDFSNIRVTGSYGKVTQWQVLQGRDFSPALKTDSAALILNEAAVKYMGLKKPLGEIITFNHRPHTVIGVVKDMVMSSPYEPARQTIFYLSNGDFDDVVMRINPASSTHAAIEKIKAVCKKYAPGDAFDYKFVDDEYAKKFNNEERVGMLATVFAVLAVFISCLGLFGMAMFMAEQRTKEIGVRKVLGASIFNLWGQLSKDFLKLVIIALLIAVPTGYYCMQTWLLNYQYHTTVSWWVFAATASGAIIITLLTVSYQSIKAALMNPVKSLRSE